MKRLILILMTVSMFGLSACACPRGSVYEGTPYGNERTAGTSFNEEGCLKRTVF